MVNNICSICCTHSGFVICKIITQLGVKSTEGSLKCWIFFVSPVSKYKEQKRLDVKVSTVIHVTESIVGEQPRAVCGMCPNGSLSTLQHC